jgi:hypothetical protein
MLPPGLSALRVEGAPSVGHRAFQFTVTVANHARAPLKDATVLVRVGRDVVATVANNDDRFTGYARVT